MSPKEKASELANKFYKTAHGGCVEAKDCALVCVEEFISYLDIWINSLASEPEMDEMKIYWQEVKQEIKKL